MTTMKSINTKPDHYARLIILLSTLTAYAGILIACVL